MQCMHLFVIFSYNHSSVHSAFAVMPRRMMPECNPHYLLLRMTLNQG